MHHVLITTSKVENSDHVLSCWLNFVHEKAEYLSVLGRSLYVCSPQSLDGNWWQHFTDCSWSQGILDHQLRHHLTHLISIIILLMRLCQPPDGSTSPKYKLLCFITTKKLCKEKNALAFNWDRCCHLVLCLRLIPFH